MEQQNNNIRIALGAGTELKIIFAGEMQGDDGQPITWQDSIKIVQGNKSIRLTAMELATLYHAIQQPEVRAVLQERFEAEKKQLQMFEGF
jgi:hypothetical protein